MLDEILYEMKVRVIRSLKTGDMFGEQALLRDGNRTATVRCLEDTHLAYISKYDFLKLHKSVMKSRSDTRI